MFLCAKARIRDGILLSLSLAICLTVAEIVVRLIFPQEARPLGIMDPLGLTVPHSKLGTALKPNFEGHWVRNVMVRTNSIGLRDVEYTTKATAEVRILSLGDSNAFGWGVEIGSSYPKLIEKLLAREIPNCRISVINGAVYGYSTYQQRAMLSKLHSILAPDFVLATFSASNDVIEDAAMRGCMEGKSDYSGSFFYRNSHLARFALRTLSPAIYFASNRWPSYIDHTIALMGAFVEELKANSLPHEFIIIPARHQIRTQVHGGSALLSKIGMSWLLTYQNSRIVGYFEAAGVPFTDTLPTLAQRDLHQPVAFSDDDSHPNELGHHIIAQQVYGRIRAKIMELAEGKCPGRANATAESK